MQALFLSLVLTFSIECIRKYNINLYYVEEGVGGVNILLEKNFVKFLILKFSNNVFWFFRNNH